MKVYIFDYVAGHEVLRGVAELAKIVREPAQRAHAEQYLRSVGRYWIGDTLNPPVVLLTTVS